MHHRIRWNFASVVAFATVVLVLLGSPLLLVPDSSHFSADAFDLQTRPRQKSTHCVTFSETSFHQTMGLGASVASQQHDTTTAEDKTGTANKASSSAKLSRKSQRAQKVAQVQEWNKVTKAFEAKVLDPSFLALPIRASTVDAAALYDNPNDDTDANDGNNSGGDRQACLMPGTHKHLGGAYDSTDGCIYGVPANSKSVLCLYPPSSAASLPPGATDHGIAASIPDATTSQTGYRMTTIPLPERIRDGHYKWLRGIFAHGYLWAIPSWADAVLCVDVDAFWGRRPPASDRGIVELLPLPEEHTAVAKGSMQWQWHGAGINDEKTAIYCIPSNAKQVLKVDLVTKTTSLIPVQGYESAEYPNFSIDTTNKWYGGIVGNDNCVYGIPYRTCAVLKIDCTADTATLIGKDHGSTRYNWHGGIQVAGKIYAHPSHADTVLVIDTNPGADQVCYQLPIARAAYDTDPRANYKWLGGALGLDGNIYCPACDTSAILKIDVTTGECITFGYSGTLKNKWQGGILARDGCIYCIPASGLQVCRIATDPAIEGDKPVQLLGDLPVHKDKWQGGYVGQDGSLYFIPENGYRVLKVTPPAQPPTVVDGKLPDDDVTLELM